MFVCCFIVFFSSHLFIYYRFSFSLPFLSCIFLPFFFSSSIYVGYLSSFSSLCVCVCVSRCVCPRCVVPARRGISFTPSLLPSFPYYSSLLPFLYFSFLNIFTSLHFLSLSLFFFLFLYLSFSFSFSFPMTLSLTLYYFFLLFALPNDPPSPLLSRLTSHRRHPHIILISSTTQVPSTPSFLHLSPPAPPTPTSSFSPSLPLARLKNILRQASILSNLLSSSAHYAHQAAGGNGVCKVMVLLMAVIGGETQVW